MRCTKCGGRLVKDVPEEDIGVIIGIAVIALIFVAAAAFFIQSVK